MSAQSISSQQIVSSVRSELATALHFLEYFRPTPAPHYMSGLFQFSEWGGEYFLAELLKNSVSSNPIVSRQSLVAIALRVGYESKESAEASIDSLVSRGWLLFLFEEACLASGVSTLVHRRIKPSHMGLGRTEADLLVAAYKAKHGSIRRRRKLWIDSKTCREILKTHKKSFLKAPTLKLLIENEFLVRCELSGRQGFQISSAGFQKSGVNYGMAIAHLWKTSRTKTDARSAFVDWFFTVNHYHESSDFLRYLDQGSKHSLLSTVNAEISAIASAGSAEQVLSTLGPDSDSGATAFQFSVAIPQEDVSVWGWWKWLSEIHERESQIGYLGGKRYQLSTLIWFLLEGDDHDRYMQQPRFLFEALSFANQDPLILRDICLGISRRRPLLLAWMLLDPELAPVAISILSDYENWSIDKHEMEYQTRNALTKELYLQTLDACCRLLCKGVYASLKTDPSRAATQFISCLSALSTQANRRNRFRQVELTGQELNSAFWSSIRKHGRKGVRTNGKIEFTFLWEAFIEELIPHLRNIPQFDRLPSFSRLDTSTLSIVSELIFWISDSKPTDESQKLILQLAQYGLDLYIESLFDSLFEAKGSKFVAKTWAQSHDWLTEVDWPQIISSLPEDKLNFKFPKVRHISNAVKQSFKDCNEDQHSELFENWRRRIQFHLDLLIHLVEATEGERQSKILDYLVELISLNCENVSSEGKVAIFEGYRSEDSLTGYVRDRLWSRTLRALTECDGDIRKRFLANTLGHHFDLQLLQIARKVLKTSEDIDLIDELISKIDVQEFLQNQYWWPDIIATAKYAAENGDCELARDIISKGTENVAGRPFEANWKNAIAHIELLVLFHEGNLEELESKKYPTPQGQGSKVANQARTPEEDSFELQKSILTAVLVAEKNPSRAVDELEQICARHPSDASAAINLMYVRLLKASDESNSPSERAEIATAAEEGWNSYIRENEINVPAEAMYTVTYNRLRARFLAGNHNGFDLLLRSLPSNIRFNKDIAKLAVENYGAWGHADQGIVYAEKASKFSRLDSEDFNDELDKLSEAKQASSFVSSAGIAIDELRNAYSEIIRLPPNKLVSVVGDSEDLDEWLLNKLIYACKQTLKSLQIIKTHEEDNLTNIVMKVLSSNLREFHWQIREQDPMGRPGQAGSTGRLGRPDTHICDNYSESVCIVEALRLDSVARQKIIDHWTKIFTYDNEGLPFGFLLMYYQKDQFRSFWKKYWKKIRSSEVKEKLPYEIRQATLLPSFSVGSIQVGKTVHDRHGQRVTVYHIAMNAPTA